MRPALRLLAALAAASTVPPAAAQAPGGLPPDAANTERPNSSVGGTGQVPSTAYPDAPVAAPSAEGANRARPPTESEKTGVKAGTGR